MQDGKIHSVCYLRGVQMMKIAPFLLLCGLAILTGQSVRPTSTAQTPPITGGATSQSQRKSNFTLSDIAKFEWVDKRCRMWNLDGDIDVDQTCLLIFG